MRAKASLAKMNRPSVSLTTMDDGEWSRIAWKRAWKSTSAPFGATPFVMSSPELRVPVMVPVRRPDDRVGPGNQFALAGAGDDLVFGILEFLGILSKQTQKAFPDPATAFRGDHGL